MALATTKKARRSPSKTAQFVSELISRYPPGFDLGLDRVRLLLVNLDHPDKKMPPVIHVAGTNGKGSTIALMQSILIASGKKVHVHTSPHLVDWHERYRIANELISDEKLLRALEQVESCLEAHAPIEGITVFEILTATAFLLFAQNTADYVLLETGLGGEFDATNVIEKPLICVITPIDYDHESYLGDTLAQIAKAKAGIIKQHCPVVVGAQQDEALDVLNEKALQMGSCLLVQNQDFEGFSQNGRMLFQDENGLRDLPLPALVGAHQIENAALAIASLVKAGVDLTDEEISEGLRKTSWPGRMQKLQTGALFEHAPSNAEIWLDGGHNPHAAKMVAQTVRECLGGRPLVMIFGMLNTKQPAPFLEAFSDMARQVICVPLETSQAAIAADELTKIASEQGFDAVSANSLRLAFEQIADSEMPPLILICGSLYLVGDALALNGTPPN